MRLTPEFEKTLRRYVQGDLDEALRDELEELLVTDPEAFEALGVVEDELVEEYLEAGASAPGGEGLAQGLLASADGRRRLLFTRALKERAAAEATRPADPAREVVGRAAAVAARPSWIETLVDALRPKRWQPAGVAVASALALSLSANVWLASRRPASPGPSPAATPSLVLAPGLLRAEGTLPRLAIPPDAPVVRLVCELSSQDYAHYRAAVLDDDGEEVWSASRLRAEPAEGRSVLALLVPAALLTRGDYRVTLAGVTEAGAQEPLSSSPLRVTTP